ncbi:MAG: hypothetical protein ACE37F_21320 [Nannocystaceae bacterium]|nr:hypothetical protein [bacterium]
MSWAKIVKKYCNKQAITYDGDNREGFVPSRSREPHLHIGSDHVTFTDVGHSHTSVCDGNGSRSGARDLVDSLGESSDPDVLNIQRVVKHLVDEY